GEFRPGGAGTEWCDTEVLRRLRRRSLAKLRREAEPASPLSLARFVPGWQHVGQDLRGVDGLLRVIEQLQGAAVPASALERLVLPSRVTDYSPAMLDELCATGEVIWAGQGALPGSDGWIALYLSETSPLLLPQAQDDLALTALHQAVLGALADGGALFFRQLSDRAGALDDQALVAALWELAWAGRVTNDTLAPLRTLLGSGRTTHRARPARPRGRYARRPAMPSRTGPPTAAGRWSLLPERDPDPTRRAHALAETLLDRHGIVTRGAVVAERTPGGFAAAYRVLTAFEEAGHCRRGYFVEGLGAAQFAVPGAVDRMRAVQAAAERRGGGEETPRALVLAAADPANPYGAALPWPPRHDEGGASHKPGRKAGALVVLTDGTPALYVERGGKTLLSWTDDRARLQPAVDALALAVREGSLGRLTVQRADGEAIHSSPLAESLAAAGFHATPRGLRLRG
ncbi:MAG: Lhr family helicase, partial [Carbonactinosporaceae bacterium]